MTKLKKEPDHTTLIQQARQALSQGEEKRARELALLATADPALEEQAWLVLASLSEPRQAMLYIENMLKVNPDSQAARKAIRLVYGQMTAGGEAQTPLEDTPPIKPLDDTAPIPVSHTAPANTILERKEETEEQITDPAEEQVSPSATISKGALRDKLRQRTSSQATEKPASMADEAALPEVSPKKKFNFSRTAKPMEEAEEPQGAEAAESTESAQISTPAAEPEVEIAPQKPAAAPEPEEIQAAAPAALPAESPAPAVEEAQAPKEPEPEPVTSLPEQKPAQKAVEELLSGKSSRMVAVNKPEQVPHAQNTPAAEKSEVHNNNQDPANVDTIELILVSVAAILLPLLVFLYFYLTK